MLTLCFRITAVSDLDRESKLTVHFQIPWHQQKDLLHPLTRPPCIEELHQFAIQKLQSLHKGKHENVQVLMEFKGSVAFIQLIHVMLRISILTLGGCENMTFWIYHIDNYVSLEDHIWNDIELIVFGGCGVNFIWLRFDMHSSPFCVLRSPEQTPGELTLEPADVAG